MNKKLTNVIVGGFAHPKEAKTESKTELNLAERLDAGEFDNYLTAGLRAIATEIDSKKPRRTHEVIYWRWIVAALFTLEMKEKNGVAEMPDGAGGICIGALYVGDMGEMPVMPIAERCSLANHVEEVGIRRYGEKKGEDAAVMFYQKMTQANKASGALELSPFGRKALFDLHDAFLLMLHTESAANAPKTH
ncbi:hypothetical protein [Hafnia paralvei]|uniref:hypothetical protein n=1 Tax=Hafnia paralvei TaxID=546367 RepID=UPI000BB56C79|nr:hypothetical protein [Hafnia paralvei]PNK67805.1 hypothetical protein A6J69_012495 [Hafnia paralvei]